MPATELSRGLRIQIKHHPPIKELSQPTPAAPRPPSPIRYSGASGQRAFAQAPIRTLLQTSLLTLARLLFSFLPTYRNVILQVGKKEKTKRLIRRRSSMHSIQFFDDSLYAFQVLESRGFHDNTLNFKGCVNLEFTFNEGCFITILTL